jgi:Cellulose-binding Sde182, nucleoside hydrolase-like domain/Cellulose-binding protein Sde0182, C-terminal domain
LIAAVLQVRLTKGRDDGKKAQSRHVKTREQIPTAAEFADVARSTAGKQFQYTLAGRIAFASNETGTCRGLMRNLLIQLVITLGACGVLIQNAGADERLRLIVETDAGGDPDDEQSLVRFLLYANEWDVEGIIANRPEARRGENQNLERTGLGITRRLILAYGQCYSNLVQHDSRYPAPDLLLRRTVAGYDDVEDGVNLILSSVDRGDPRPVWFLNWGTIQGCAVSSLKRALDRVRRERGEAGYAAFKKRLRLSSDNQFEPHTSTMQPPFELWVDTFRPPVDGKRWYHRFSTLTATAGGFDLRRDVLSEHGPLGALYPTNTTHWQKEGDTMTFLYLVPTGMNDPMQPGWGSWAGRYGTNETFSGLRYFWANQKDQWRGSNHRDNTLARWAADLQNDFRARLNWCVTSGSNANHSPVALVNAKPGKEIVLVTGATGSTLRLSAEGSYDPDGNKMSYEWFNYQEAGTYGSAIALTDSTSKTLLFKIPKDAKEKTIHILLRVTDDGAPPLAAYRRIVVQVSK